MISPILETLAILDEQPSSHEGVCALVSGAFGHADEARLVRELTQAGDVAISLIAEADDRVVGHVLLTRMTAPFRALALAPLAVEPAYQRRGIGSALVGTAMERARSAGWEAIFVLGDPAYYERFGFEVAAARGFSTPYSGDHFMVLPLAPPLPTTSGELLHAPAFSALD